MHRWLARFAGSFLDEDKLLSGLGLSSWKRDERGQSSRLPGRPVDLLNNRPRS